MNALPNSEVLRLVNQETARLEDVIISNTPLFVARMPLFKDLQQKLLTELRTSLFTVAGIEPPTDKSAKG